MNSHGKTESLQVTVDALRAHGVVPGVAAALDDGLDAVRKALKQTVLEEVLAYSDSANPDILPDLENHLGDHVARITALLGGSRGANFEFVCEHAERLAQQRFPLEALLHTYRCAHKVLSPWLRDIALDQADNTAHVRRVVASVADFAIEYTDTISTTATATYVNHTRLLAEAEGLADHVVVLDQGHALVEGAPDALTRHYWPEPVVRFAAEDPTSLDYLAGLPGVSTYHRSADPSSDRATVTLRETGSVPELVELLVARGIRVTRVDPHEPTLEDLYFAVRGDQRGVTAPAIGGTETR